MPHATKSTSMESCITACKDCEQACLECFDHCLEMGGEHASRDHITTLADCAEICATSAAFMLRGSNLHAETCRACATICDACAESCDAMGKGDGTIARCAEACRACAEECRKMAA
jgi:hypothetical protein